MNFRDEPSLRVFGDLSLNESARKALRFPTRKAALLLAYLASAPDARCRRDKLCRVFWPDRAEPQARNSLRQTLSALRKLTPEPSHAFVGADTEHVWIVDPAATVDCIRFETLAKSGNMDALVDTAKLYVGRFLDSTPVPEDLEGWRRDNAARFVSLAGEIVEKLSRSGGDEDVVANCRRLATTLLEDDEADERAHRALIRLHLAGSRPNEARRQYDACRAATRAAFGAEPEPATAALLSEPVPTVEKAAGPRSPASSPDAARPSLVILPFDDLAPEGENDFFADGVVEEITAALSRAGDFFVIARQTAIAFKDQLVPLDEIGDRLGVRYAVEGTVRRGGSLVRLYIHLVDTSTSRQIWSERFDGRIEDVFELQDEIAIKVAAAISPTIRSSEILLARSKPPENRQAYDCVLAGLPRLWSHTKADNAAARGLFERALELAPDYGRAMALLAWCHAQDVVYYWSDDPDRSRTLCSRHVREATPLIQNDPTALAAVGAAISQAEGDQERARVFLARALAIDPNNAWAWARSGWAHFFSGRYEEAGEAFSRAKALSPLDPLGFNLEFGLAGVFFAHGNYREAAALSRATIDAHPGITWAYRQYATYAALAGEIDEAREAMRIYREAYPEVTIATNLKNHPQRNNPHYMELFLKGLRLSGLPEE